MHVIAAKAVAFGEALRPEFKHLCHSVVDNAKVLAETLLAGRLRHRLRRHRHPSDAGRSAAEGPDRQGGGGGARPRPHHLQQERHSVRSGKADGHLGHPARHAGGTTRGFGVAEFREVGELIADSRSTASARRAKPAIAQVEAGVRDKVHVLCNRFPIYRKRRAVHALPVLRSAPIPR